MDFATFAVLSLGSFGALHYWFKTRTIQSGVPAWTWLVLGLVLGLGAVAVDTLGRRAGERQANLLLSFAPVYALELERLGHRNISLTTPADDPGYLEMIDLQRRWLARNQFVNDIYTFRASARPDSVTLIVDSETDYDRNGRFEGAREARTEIGESTKLSGPAIAAALRGTGSFHGEPYTDRWGTWVSAYWPLARGDGTVEAVLGIDYDARTWQREIAAARHGGIAMTVVFVCILFGVTWSRHLQRQELAARAETERALRAAADSAEAANHLKTQFLACLSHEVNTPVNGVHGVSEILLHARLAPEHHRYVLTLHRAATTLKHMVTDILEYARIETNQFTLANAPFNPLELVETVAMQFAEALAEKSVEIIVAAKANLPSVLHGDGARIAQVLNHLVRQAAETNPGAITLQASTTEAGSHVRFAVQGAGESRQEMQRQNHQAATSLGLSLCRKLVTLMGGVMGADSGATGNRRWFDLPLACADTSLDTGDTAALGNRRVAILTSTPAVGASLREQLEDWGMSALQVESTEDAEVLLSRATRMAAPIEILLVDRCLPGVKLPKWLASVATHPEFPPPRVLLLCAESELMEAPDLVAHHAHGQITKPVRRTLLLNKLTAALVARPLESLPPPAVEAVTTPAPLLSHHARVLVLEPESSIRALLTAQLSELGIAAVDAADERSALVMIVDGMPPVDAVIARVRGDGLDVWAFTRMLREFEASHRERARLPVFIALEDSRTEDALAAADIDEALLGPITTDMLDRALSTRLQRRRLSDAA